MSAIKEVCGAIKEDKVNEWLKDSDRKVEVSGDKWSDEEFELFERERCRAVRESVNSCGYAGIYGSPFNASIGSLIKAGSSAILVSSDGKIEDVDIYKKKQSNIRMAIRTEWLVHSLSILSLIIAAFLIFGGGL